jgi:hypothetical protein
MGDVLFAPKTTLTVSEVIELAVRAKYGPEAIAPPESFDIDIPPEAQIPGGDRKKLLVRRAGVEISYTEDCERWDRVREDARRAFASREMDLLRKDQCGKLDRVLLDWDSNTAYLTIFGGKLRNPGDPVDGQMWFVEEDQALEWIWTTYGGAPETPRDDKDTPTDEDRPGRNTPRKQKRSTRGMDENHAQQSVFMYLDAVVTREATERDMDYDPGWVRNQKRDDFIALLPPNILTNEHWEALSLDRKRRIVAAWRKDYLRRAKKAGAGG